MNGSAFGKECVPERPSSADGLLRRRPAPITVIEGMKPHESDGVE